MSEFALNEQQREFVRNVREIAESELLDHAAGGQPGSVNRELLRAMGKHGLLGRLYDERARRRRCSRGGRDGTGRDDPGATDDH